MPQECQTENQGVMDNLKNAVSYAISAFLIAATIGVAAAAIHTWFGDEIPIRTDTPMPEAVYTEVDKRKILTEETNMMIETTRGRRYHTACVSREDAENLVSKLKRNYKLHNDALQLFMSMTDSDYNGRLDPEELKRLEELVDKYN